MQCRVRDKILLLSRSRSEFNGMDVRAYIRKDRRKSGMSGGWKRVPQNGVARAEDSVGSPLCTYDDEYKIEVLSK